MPREDAGGWLNRSPVVVVYGEHAQHTPDRNHNGVIARQQSQQDIAGAVPVEQFVMVPQSGVPLVQ